MKLLNYIYVIIAALLITLDISLSKKYQSIEGISLAAGLKFNAMNGLFTAFIFWAVSGFKVEISLFSLSMALGIASFGVLYTLIAFRILKAGSLRMYSMFLMGGGMLLPYVFGIIFLKESLTLYRICSVLLILAAIMISNRTKQAVDKWQRLLCVGVFILNGLVGIVSKCHQINSTYEAVDSVTFVMYTGVWKFILCSAVLLFVKDEHKKTFANPRPVLAIIASGAIVSGSSYMLQLVGARELPASVLYPIFTGGSIVFSTVIGRIFFKEKASILQLIGIGLCFIGMCLFI